MNSGELILKISHEYSLYVAKYRSIPHVADGCKTSQRLILYTLRKRADKIKTAALTGEIMAGGSYHHGDQSCNQAISYLAAPFKNNVALVTPHGAFGTKIAPESIGSARYTYVSRSKHADAFMYADSDLIPMTENYEGEPEPISFLPLIPCVLLNGVSGIAVGFSTEILPRDFYGLVDATLDALKDKKELRGLEPRYMKYDVETKSLGNNQYEFSGKVRIEKRSIVITELPPGINLEAFRTRLIKLEDGGLIQGFVDRSRDTINVEVKMRREVIENWTEDQAIDFFKIRYRTTERIVVVSWDGKSIKTYDNPETLVREFVQWRLGWYTKRYERMRDLAKIELSYWQLINALFESGFTNRFKGFESKADMVADIERVASRKKIEVGDSLDRVLNLPSYRWVNEFHQTVISKIAEIEASIKEYEAILSSPDRLKAIYIAEVAELKKLKV